MQFTLIASFAVLASFMAPALAQFGPPAGCKQTATGKVGFCICSTATVVPSTKTEIQTITLTTTTAVETVTDVTSYVTDSTYLRGPSCFPSAPYQKASPSS